MRRPTGVIGNDPHDAVRTRFMGWRAIPAVPVFPGTSEGIFSGGLIIEASGRQHPLHYRVMKGRSLLGGLRWEGVGFLLHPKVSGPIIMPGIGGVARWWNGRQIQKQVLADDMMRPEIVKLPAKTRRISVSAFLVF